MGNPAELADIIKVNASIAAGGGISQQSFSEPVFVSTFNDSGDFPDRIKGYAGTLSEMQASLVADGFAANDAAYRQITAAGVQDGSPDLIYIGRVDPADLNYSTGLTAIWDEASANDQSLYFTCVDERDPASIEEIADWTNQRTFVLYMAATASAAVKNNSPGNVAASILAKGYDTTALVWHEPVVASGYGPATLTSLRGPFVLPQLSGDVQFRINDGALQTLLLVANPAVLLGTNAETFAIANGDQFTTTIDSGSVQTITASLLPATTASASENFNIPNGSSLLTSFNGATPLSSVFTGTSGAVTTSDELYVPVVADFVTFDIDGTGSQVINFAATDVSRVLVKAKLDALTGVTVVDTGTSIVITSLTTGSASDVEIVAGSANMLAELGLVVSNNAGTGFAGNFAAVTASQLQVKLAADYAAAGVVTVEGTTVQIATIKKGKSAEVRVLSGLANDGIGFSTSSFKGAGTFNDGALVLASEVVSWFGEALYDVSATVDTGAIKLKTRTRGSASVIDIGASTLATTFGFALGTQVSVGSNVGNAAVVQASEVSNVLNALPLVDGATSSASARFSIASLINGPTSTVAVVGGSYADVLFDTFTASGTGTDEDYIECAYVGRMATLKLDEPSAGGGGQSTWDNAPLKGILPDSLSASERKVLHETLKVNTFENRQGRNEMHFGTVCWGNADNYRYIDQRVSIDWGWARSVETFKTTLNNLANAKARAPNTDNGIQLLANDWKALLQRGAANGHWIYDGSAITSVTDTGITIPTRAQQTNANISLRKVSGFVARFQFLDSIHRVNADLTLTSFAEFNIAA